MIRILCSFVLLLFFLSCSNEVQQRKASADFKLFEKVTATHSKIFFKNQLTESKFLNSITVEGFLAGAGVAILDVNNDDLPDIYFGGNQVQDKLYLNKGKFLFEDISSTAGITNDKRWTSGIAVADVNGDGFDDIYVCKALDGQAVNRQNLLYINQGNNTFSEQASHYGIADQGFSIMANFFDYDLDGDLDLYVANQPPGTLAFRTSKKESLDYRFTDRLYRNDGNTFTDVTETSGIKNYSYTLSATVSDVNKDGYPDIYVACDYEEPDYLYINQKNGTFVNKANEAFRHISNLSMGVDIADVNNDGWLDIFVADMVAEDNFRNKTNMSGMNPQAFWMLVNSGFHHQYMFNTLQINNGNGTYSEVAQMAGVSHSDWSWSPLFIDADNDSNRDLLVTNGQIKEMRNKDFLDGQRLKIDSLKAQGKDQYDILYELSKGAPQQKIANYMYQNLGDLKFAKVMEKWGLDEPNWSQGAAYADFDGDGDLDLVLNNMNTEASLYENKAVDNQLNNSILIDLEGPISNKRGFQAKIELKVGSNTYYAEMTPVRGYMSCSEPVFHFGLGSASVIDQITVFWQDGKVNIIEKQKANKKISINYKDAKPRDHQAEIFTKTFVRLESKEIRHKENDFDDYEREILIPHKMSTLGPAFAKGDINGDGLEDFYIGGASEFPGQLYIQNESGGFNNSQETVFEDDKAHEDIGAVFFDMDGDGDQDLYVVSGGNEKNLNNPYYQDRLYENEGAVFSKVSLPEIRNSGSVVLPLDYDADNDMDLFIGGRQIPGFYGRAASSLILENTGEGFKFSQSAKAFENVGMVTDAVWTDLNNDQKNELVVVGEWMEVRVFEYANGSFHLSDLSTSFNETSGWWNTISASDIDQDGDTDLIAGNLGLNIKYKANKEKPFKLYFNDFDQNGTHDVYLAYYDMDSVLYPVRGRECSSQQMPFIKEKFKSYGSFAKASIDEVLDGRMQGSEVLSSQIFESVVFLNEGDGHFSIKPLPNEAQISPINGMLIKDFNGDQNEDILTVGNYYNREVETTRSDASIGCLLLGDGRGNFKAQHPSKSGLISYKDAREILELKGKNFNQIAVANNNSSIDLYRTSQKANQ